MLRFFRQIRQRLLPIAIGTDNKLSKYLLYAIGEILLVVIGILIALQVDNWNEERREAEEIRVQLENLVRDLKADKYALEDTRGFNAFRVHAASYLLEQYDGSQKIKAFVEAGEIPKLDETGFWSGPVPESLDKDFTVKAFSWVLRSNPQKLTTDSFEEFKSTGLFALFNNQDIKNKLLEYYRDYFFVFPLEEHHESNTLLLRNSLASQGYSYLDVALLENPIEELLSIPTNLALVKNIIDESTFRSGQASYFIKDLDQLISKIEVEINNYPSY